MINKGLSYIGIGFLYPLSLLPFWALYLISDFAFIIIYHVVGYRRKVVQENLRNSFPEKTEQERHIIEKKYFGYLCDLIVETIKAITASKSTLTKRFMVANPEVVEQCFSRGKGFIGACAHYGNWELAGIAFSSLTDQPRLVVYKPLSNPVFEKFLTKVRSRWGATMVPMKTTLRKFTEHRNKPFVSAVVGDQTPAKVEAHYFTNFLNQPTAVFLGIEKLSKMLDVPVVYCDVTIVKRGFYVMQLVMIEENPKATAEYEITGKYMKYLEDKIKAKPEYWLWSHRRWKFKPEDIQ